MHIYYEMLATIAKDMGSEIAKGLIGGTPDEQPLYYKENSDELIYSKSTMQLATAFMSNYRIKPEFSDRLETGIANSILKYQEGHSQEFCLIERMETGGKTKGIDMILGPFAHQNILEDMKYNPTKYADVETVTGKTIEGVQKAIATKRLANIEQELGYNPKYIKSLDIIDTFGDDFDDAINDIAIEMKNRALQVKKLADDTLNEVRYYNKVNGEFIRIAEDEATGDSFALMTYDIDLQNRKRRSAMGKLKSLSEGYDPNRVKGKTGALKAAKAYDRLQTTGDRVLGKGKQNEAVMQTASDYIYDSIYTGAYDDNTWNNNKDYRNILLTIGEQFPNKTYREITELATKKYENTYGLLPGIYGRNPTDGDF